MLLEPIIRHARFKWLLLGIVSFALATWLYFGHYLDDFHLSKISISTLKTKISGSNEIQVDRGLPWPAAPEQLWRILQPMLDENAPDVSKLTQDDGFASQWYDPAAVDRELLDRTTMSSADVLKMREKHRKFVDDINSKLPSYFSTKDAPKRGIVTVAGGYHFPIFFVSLRMLRRTGCDLPVEVFLPNEEEYEKEICEEVLPQYNAKCITLTSIFNYGDGRNKPAKGIEKYQYKIFSLLFSSFEEILFLDSDSFPIQDPTPLFTSTIFVSTGLITWPDFWATSASPLFYLISGLTPPKPSDRATMESGQFLISKKLHHKTLVLSSYYNYYGPDLYYDLLCQGGAGKGDKETFYPAARVFSLPFYDVRAPVKGVGHPKPEPSQFYVFAMIQYDPLLDHAQTREGKQLDAKPRPFFLHVNTPKWNAKNVLDISPPYVLTEDLSGKKVPAFTVPEENVAEIAGIERQIWDETKWVGCELEDKFRDFEEKRPGICQRLEDYFRNTLDGLLDPETGETNTTATGRRRSLRFEA